VYIKKIIIFRVRERIMERDGWMGRIAFVALLVCVCVRVAGGWTTVCVWEPKIRPHVKILDC
jgi:hypothetical protein